jgi:hypothetical protein
MLLKGLALTPPVIGRITIGKVVERNGKRLPEKDDEFTLTSQVQQREGWVAHPVDQVLRKATPGAKLRTIPIRLLFDDPDLNMRASYSLFDRNTGRPICIGDGQTCKRSTAEGMQALPCPTPDACEPSKGQCKPFGRLNVRVDSSIVGGANTEPQPSNQGDEDTLGSFIFRTTGFNSIRTLATRLRYFHAVANGRLSTMPLELRLRGKSTAQSHRAPIYYVDMAPRTGYALTDAVSWAMTEWDRRQATGFNQDALDEAARTGFSQGAFEESAEEVQSVVEEFFPIDQPATPAAGVSRTPGISTLTDKLADKLGATSNGQASNDIN